MKVEEFYIQALCEDLTEGEISAAEKLEPLSSCKPPFIIVPIVDLYRSVALDNGSNLTAHVNLWVINTPVTIKALEDIYFIKFGKKFNLED